MAAQKALGMAVEAGEDHPAPGTNTPPG
jgi:hypothetical protein